MATGVGGALGEGAARGVLVGVVGILGDNLAEQINQFSRVIRIIRVRGTNARSSFFSTR